jgi:DNA/RNA-binding domain of Phe-tRNA-synthetase-like protein
LNITPSIDRNIASLAPDFRAISIVAEVGTMIRPESADQALNEAYSVISRGEPIWAEAHFSAWAEVFKRFGVKPKRATCSAEALRKRVIKDGLLPQLDPIVDLYNAISLQYAVPVGGENLAAYVGQPHLAIATGTEIFDTVREGQMVEESPEPGEVIWRDDRGVTCRRWNWRQGVRTRLNSDAHQMWFILESLSPMPMESLHAAANKLAQGIEHMMTDAKIEMTLIELEKMEDCHVFA